jgi:hypothetical protein
MRVGYLVGYLEGYLVGYLVGLRVAGVGLRVAGACCTVEQTDLLIAPTERERALKPLVRVIAFFVEGELTQDFTVSYLIPLPISTIITWIPAFFAA